MMSALGIHMASAGGALFPATRSNRLVTLIYHRVRTVRDEMFPGEVTADVFEWHMRLLSKHCQPLPLRQAIPMLQEGKLPSRAVAVTFDDGYEDNASVALPILKSHSVPATFFVATSFLGDGIMFNDAVAEAVRQAPGSRLSIPELQLADADISSMLKRGAVAQALINKIKHASPQQRAQSVQRITDRCGATSPTNLMMSAAQVKLLHDSGMEVGAHTQTHPILQVLDPESARREIDGSRQELEKIIQARVTAFAYPNGRPGEDYGQRERELVAELGFQYTVATRWGAAMATTDKYQLPRFTPWDRQPAKWLARLLLTFRDAVV
jgi:peptidoglycan/xylan/chitin deacetylase (PgdA/CDA1 family)